MGWGDGENGVEGGMGEGSPAVTIMLKPNPRFVDVDNVGCLVCEVEEGMHNI